MTAVCCARDHRVGLGVIGERPVAAAEGHGSHHRRRRAVGLDRVQGDDALVVGDELVVGVARVLQHHRKQRAVVVGQHQRRQLVGKGDEARGLGRAFLQHRRREHEADRPVLAQQRDRIGRHRLAVRHRLRQHRPDRPSAGRRRGREQPIVSGLRGSRSISTLIGLSIALMSSGWSSKSRIVGLVKPELFSSALARRQFARLEPRDPGGDHEIGLEGIDRRAQRLQHVGLDHRGRAKQAGRHARQQFALGQPVLHQAGMHVDRARQRDAVERQFLIVDAIGRETGEQNSDQRDKADDETQPNHSLTRE